MAKFLVRRFFTLILTMLMVSIIVFAVSEIAPGNVVRHILGQFATPEQEASLRNQLGLDRPAWKRYAAWLVGSDWTFARPKVGMPMRRIVTEEGFAEWWVEATGDSLVRWRMESDDLIATAMDSTGSEREYVDNRQWNVNIEAERQRLAAVREELLTDPQLLEADRRRIVEHIESQIRILSKQGLSDEQVLEEIEPVSQDLEGLIDPDALQARSALQQAAVRARATDVVQALEAMKGFRQRRKDPKGEELTALATSLRKGAAALRDVDAEAADRLSQASKFVNKREFQEAEEAIEAVEDSLASWLHPIPELIEALNAGAFFRASDILVLICAPGASIETPEAQSIKAHVLRGLAAPLEEALPILWESIVEATSGLEEGDVSLAEKALQEAAVILREEAPAIAKTTAAESAKVGKYFWGVDEHNRAVLWVTRTNEDLWLRSLGAGFWVKKERGPIDYIPLRKGLLRGDPGESIRTRRPVSQDLKKRLRNSGVLAGIGFVAVMPLAVFLGLLAGINEGKPIDRVLSLFGLLTTSSPDFATGVFLILVFGAWLRILPGATVFSSPDAIFEKPEMLVLPVATLTLIELGYVLRITRASVVEVMESDYVRTAILKGLPYWKVVIRHVLRNALLAPITIIMLHVNWLIGGVVVVEAIFGYPGLGTYILTSAQYKDVFAIEATTMVMVALAVGTQVVADVAYTILNPRIRYE